MRWENLNDSVNGMKSVLLIMTVEWLLLLFLTYYLNQLSSFTVGRRNPTFYLKCFDEKGQLSTTKSMLQRQISKVFIEIDRPDVSKEVRSIVLSLF